MAEIYFFKGSNCPYLEDIEVFIMHSVPNAHGTYIQINEKKFSPTYSVSLVHEALKSLENDPKQYLLIGALRSYLKSKPPKDINDWKNMGEHLGMVISVIVSIYSLAAVVSIVPPGVAFSAILAITSAIAALCIITIMLIRYVGGLLGTTISNHINKNRVEHSQLEEKLKKLTRKDNEKDENISILHSPYSR